MAGERVLVCDDELAIVRALRVVLRDAGYDVVVAATAEEALDRAAVRPPDAAIVDQVAPRAVTCSSSDRSLRTRRLWRRSPRRSSKTRSSTMAPQGASVVSARSGRIT